MPKVTIPIRLAFSVPEPISANDRLNRYETATRVQTIRVLSFAAWQNAARPQLDRAHVTATIQFKDALRRDIANYAPTIKAAIDGMVAEPRERSGRRMVGILPDDDTRHLSGPDLRLHPDPNDWLRGVRVELVFDPDRFESPAVTPDAAPAALREEIANELAGWINLRHKPEDAADAVLAIVNRWQ